MLIYDFSGRGTHPLYEYLYHCLKADILNGRIPAASSRLDGSLVPAGDRKSVV